MAITDTQHSVVQLVLVSFKELDVKTIWPRPDTIFIEVSPVFVYLNKKANWN